MDNFSLAGCVDALLPQIQCGRCGFSACGPYAAAIARGEADINRCSPGGESTIETLARLLGEDPEPLDPECVEEVLRTVAVIDEGWCVGCARCLAVCPVDAIVGAPGQMHTVIGRECTGCGRCVDSCPMDCISMAPVIPLGAALEANPDACAAAAGGQVADWPSGWGRLQADTARRRYQARQTRLAHRQRERSERLEQKRLLISERASGNTIRRAAIEAVLARVHARREGHTR